MRYTINSTKVTSFRKQMESIMLSSEGKSKQEASPLILYSIQSTKKKVFFVTRATNGVQQGVRAPKSSWYVRSHRKVQLCYCCYYIVMLLLTSLLLKAGVQPFRQLKAVKLVPRIPLRGAQPARQDPRHKKGGGTLS